jgi:uncharacterized protein (DUF433 family)
MTERSSNSPTESDGQFFMTEGDQQACMASIVQDSEIRSGAPRIESTRITVLDIKRRVIDGDEDPFAVAADYDLDVAAVFTALAYFYDNVETMRERENEREQLRQRLQNESDQLRQQLAGDSVPESQ